MPNNQNNWVNERILNYVTANHFYVEIKSEIKACFSECSGLGVQIDKEPFFEGGVNDQQRILLKQAKFNDITLKHGITDDMLFWQWISQVLEGKAKQRLNIKILIFNQAGETMQTWTLIGAVPVGWKAPALQANSNTVAIEELTLAYEGLNMYGEKWEKQKTQLEGIERDKSSGYFPSN
jgi:phage tail-like protein